MKHICIIIMIAVSAMIASCGSSSEEQKTKPAEDSVKKVDSVAKVILGKWKEAGGDSYLVIVMSGELYTVTDGDVTFAYKLDGQVLKSVDDSGPIYSLIDANTLLKGSTKYTKSGDDDTESTSEEATEADSKDKSSASSDAKDPKTVTQTKTSTVTEVPKVLTIVCNNTTNLFQSARVGAIVKSLSDGTECTIIAKGSQGTLSGTTDYWYNVKVDGFKGWVFGAYTSLKQK